MIKVYYLEGSLYISSLKTPFPARSLQCSEEDTDIVISTRSGVKLIKSPFNTITDLNENTFSTKNSLKLYLETEFNKSELSVSNLDSILIDSTLLDGEINGATPLTLYNIARGN